ncbi:MAG: hypothetical protein R6U25_04665 [Alkalispirochaeta sp.]
MTRTIAMGLIVAFSVAVSPLLAESMHMEEDWGLSEEQLLPYNEAIDQFMDEHATSTIDEITIGDLRQLGATLSIVAQEEDYVRRAAQASHLMPGSGHFGIGEIGRGVAFLAGSAVVTAGTLAGAYFLLPEEVQFGELDYINDSFREIGSTWRGESIASLLPSFGVLLGGGLIHSILGELASNDAEKIARRQIESGEKSFDPQPFIYPDARGRLILGARIGL